MKMKVTNYHRFTSLHSARNIFNTFYSIFSFELLIIIFYSILLHKKSCPLFSYLPIFPFAHFPPVSQVQRYAHHNTENKSNKG